MISRAPQNSNMPPALITFTLVTMAAALAATGSYVTASALVPTPSTALTQTCTAIDGDTLDCQSGRIRLAAIDAPEMPGHCRKGRRCEPGDPEEAKQRLQALITGPLTIIVLDKDHYGRDVAAIQNQSGRDLSCAMIAAGTTYKSRWDKHLTIMRTCPRTVLNQSTAQHQTERTKNGRL